MKDKGKMKKRKKKERYEKWPQQNGIVCLRGGGSSPKYTE
jgi:hypothetical protein